MTATRMKARRERQTSKTKAASLNLVSLMDIFTILVFFLMVNSSDVQVLETSTAIKLPDSSAEQNPEERLVVSVSADDVVVMGRRVAGITDPATGEGDLLPGLRKELLYQAGRAEAPAAGRAVTIMGDQALPYEVLKRIMLTCQQSGYTRIALAVNRVTEAEV